MFTYTYRDLTIQEASNGFYITYNPMNITRGMGDMVDTFYDAKGTPLLVGTPAFYKFLEEDLRDSYHTYLKAYFGG